MYRAYHAIRGLTAPDGRSTNAIYGFVTMLRKLINDHKPECMAAAFDLSGPTFRSEMREDYKANRAAMPSDLGEQIALVHQACEALGVQVLTYAGFEADDVIGTLAMRAVAEGRPVAIVTGDKDFFQLVSDATRVRVFNPRDEGAWYDAAAVKEKFGVAPEQVVDVLALMGDTIDNIKGVPGIGEKGARELIAAHGSLDALLAAAPTLPQKRYREALTQFAEDARASRVLATIRTDVPIEFEAESLRYRGPDVARCYEIFSRLGFRNWLADYAPTAATSVHDYAVVQSVEELDALAAQIREAGFVSIGVVSTGDTELQGHLVGLSLATAPSSARYIPLGHVGLTETPNLRESDVAARLGAVLADPSIAKIGHDLKATSVLCARAGFPIAGLDLDTMIASYLVDATGSSHSLEELALQRTDYRAARTGDITGKGIKSVAINAVPATSLLNFAGERADLPLRMADGLREDLTKSSLDAIYRDMERPLIPILADIERAGVRLDLDALARLSQTMQTELDRLSASIFSMAGEEFNKIGRAHV